MPSESLIEFFTGCGLSRRRAAAIARAIRKTLKTSEEVFEFEAALISWGKTRFTAGYIEGKKTGAVFTLDTDDDGQMRLVRRLALDAIVDATPEA